MFRIPFLDKTWQNHISRAFFRGLALFELFFLQEVGRHWETKMMIWPVDTACVNQREISGRTKDGYSMGIAIEIEGITTQTEVDCGKQHTASITLLTSTHWHFCLKVDFPLINGWYGSISIGSMENHRQSIDKWMFSFFMGKSSTHFWVIFGRYGADDTRLIKPFVIFWWLPRWESSQTRFRKICCILLSWSDGYHRFLILNKMIPQNM